MGSWLVTSATCQPSSEGQRDGRCSRYDKQETNKVDAASTPASSIDNGRRRLPHHHAFAEPSRAGPGASSHIVSAAAAVGAAGSGTSSAAYTTHATSSGAATCITVRPAGEGGSVEQRPRQRR